MRWSTASSATCATRATRRSALLGRVRWRSARDTGDPAKRVESRALATRFALQDALYLAAEQIAAFHRKQLRTSWLDYSDEGALGQVVRPLDRVGVYTPGGTAVYPSSLLMTAVPARRRRAGDHRLYAAWTEWRDLTPGAGGRRSGWRRSRLGIGGVQAIAAMAYGETVPHVDKIYGPGNIFVVLAKRRVFGIVDIDQLPGPTETLLVADESADPEFVAADLLAQAEHDPMASAILITNSPMLAHAVLEELPAAPRSSARISRGNPWPRTDSSSWCPTLRPPSTSRTATRRNISVSLARSLVMRADGAARGHLRREDSPEALGDYTAGPSHVMPTGGTARFSSPINVAEFTKVISVIAANNTAMRRLGPATSTLARAEGLTAHARAIERRLERLEQE